jgi:hypothetical protein
MRALALLAVSTLSAETAAEIMAKVAANMERAAAERSQYVYEQTIRSTARRTDGKLAQQESRTYRVAPGPQTSEKKLIAVEGEIHKGKQIRRYQGTDTRPPQGGIDDVLVNSLADNLINDKDSRDGMPASLFPLTAKALPTYNFTLIETKDYKGRLTHHIAFEPRKGAEGDPWKGDAFIDALEYQPVQIATDLDFKMPFLVRTMLGTNLRQTGFNITYHRVAENVWFPVSYGSEFRLDVLFGYKRVVTMALTSSGFQRAAADSTIHFQ